MTIANEVVHFDTKSRYSNEHQNILNSLEYLNWNLQVQTIAQACGLPTGQVIENQESSPATGSLAYRLGHGNIKSFISGDALSYGLCMSWDAWIEKATAFRLKNSFGIYSDNPVDIINEFDDVVKVIGRAPFDVAEYHRAKDAVLIQQKKDVEQHSKLVIEEMQERITSLMQNAEIDRKILVTEQQRVEVLKADLSKSIQDMNIAIAKAIQDGEKDKEASLIKQKAELESFMSQKIAFIQSEAEQKVTEINNQIEQLKKIYNSDNFVSKAEYSVLEQEIERERNTSREYLLKLHDANNNMESMVIELKQKDIVISNQVSRLHEQDELINALRNQMEDIKANSSEALPLVFQSLNDKIKTLESYIVRYRQQNSAMKDNLEKQKAIATKQTKLIKQYQRKIGTLNKLIKFVSVGVIIASSVSIYCIL